MTDEGGAHLLHRVGMDMITLVAVSLIIHFEIDLIRVVLLHILNFVSNPDRCNYYKHSGIKGIEA